MKTAEELQRFYESYLRKEIEPLEEFRLQETEKAKKYNLYIAISIITFILSLFSKNGFLVFIAFFIILYFFGAQYEILAKMRKSLVKDYKNKILRHLLSFLFDDYEYIPRQKIAKSVLDKSRFISSRNCINRRRRFYAVQNRRNGHNVLRSRSFSLSTRDEKII